MNKYMAMVDPQIVAKAYMYMARHNHRPRAFSHIVQITIAQVNPHSNGFLISRQGL